MDQGLGISPFITINEQKEKNIYIYVSNNKWKYLILRLFFK